MEGKSEQKSISDAISEKIKSGHIKIRPKTHFILKRVLAVAAVILGSLFLLYLVSFIVFSLRASGAWFLPRFGLPGIKIFLSSLPWPLIALAALCIFLLELISEKFTFVYRRPLIYSSLAILVIIIGGGFLIEKTSLHSEIFRQAQRENLPPIGAVYRALGAPRIRNTRFGEVENVNQNGFVIMGPNDNTTTVIINGETKLPPDTIQRGDKIVVMGKDVDSEIKALIIRKIKENLEFFAPLSSSTPRAVPR